LNQEPKNIFKIKRKAERTVEQIEREKAREEARNMSPEEILKVLSERW